MWRVFADADDSRPIRRYIEGLDELIQVTISPGLAERPVNILFPIEILRELAEEAFVVTKDAVIPVPNGLPKDLVFQEHRPIQH